MLYYYLNYDADIILTYYHYLRGQNYDRPDSPSPRTNRKAINTRGYVLALHSLPGSAGYRLLHPRLIMYAWYDLSGFSRPLHPCPVFNKGLVVKLRFYGENKKLLDSTQ